MTNTRTGLWLAIMTSLSLGLLPSLASAATLTGMVSPDPATAMYVNSPVDPGYTVTVTAFTAQPLQAGRNSAFEQAWNTLLPGEWDPTGWTLNWSTQTLGTFDIATYDAYTMVADGRTSGGAEIRINWTPDADQTDLRWIQALYDPSRSSSSPYRLDIIRTAYPNLPPLYPYQYADQHFYDKPYRWRVLNQSLDWEAYAYLVRIDRANKICTVYEGVYWGFSIDTVAVPEPSTIVGLALCFACLLAARRTSARRGALTVPAETRLL
jgi:hypothetical protein